MVLGIGYMEILIIAGGGIYLIGSKDLPHVARMAGRATGRAVSYVSALRNRAFTFAEENELNKLHEEIQATMHQLDALRSEMRSGVNLFKPGPSGFDHLSSRVQKFSDQSNATDTSKAGTGLDSEAAINQSEERQDSEEPKLERPYQPTKQVVDYAITRKSSSSIMQDLADEDLRLTMEERHPKPH